MAKTILIAGGAGFIGSHMSERMLREGNRVICVDNLLTGSESNIAHLKDNPQFTFLNHDVTTPLPRDLSADAVFHLASPASPNHHSPISYHALPMETMLVNTQGTLRLLEFAQKHRARFLFASTSEVYGDPLEHPQKESYRGNVSTVGPRSVYDEAKRFGETLTAYFIREKALNGRIARIFNTYGPHMSKKDMRMIVAFITSALDDKPITIFGDGSQTRSLCFVDDLVEGLTRLMFYENTQGEIVNLGMPEEHTVTEYAKIVKELIGSKSDIVESEILPEDDPKKRLPDITKAKKLLDWMPTTPLRVGIQKTIEYLKTI